MYARHSCDSILEDFSVFQDVYLMDDTIERNIAQQA